MQDKIGEDIKKILIPVLRKTASKDPETI